MTASPRLRGYLLITAAGLLAAIVLGRPEPVILCAPFALALAAALAGRRPAVVDARLDLARERALEGQEVPGELVISAETAVAWAVLAPSLPRGLRLIADGPLARPLPAGETRIPARVLCDRWGGYSVGGVVVVAEDRFGLLRERSDGGDRRPLRVYPAGEHLERALAPRESQVFAGNQVARLRGDGIEFADIRAFVPGDRVRQVNWRVTARRGQLHVNEMHLERNADVVLFLDTFGELRRGAATSTIDLSVRGAAALIDLHLRRRDRVGLVSFGGTLRWLRPSMGQVQLYRLVDALIDTEVVLSYVWKGLEVIPRRTLPPKSLVVAFTPLLDDRVVAALFDLAARGHDLAVIEISAEAFLEAGRSEADRLAHRLWLMEREALRDRFRQFGVPIVHWHPESGFSAALDQVREFRRRARAGQGGTPAGGLAG